MTSFRSGLLAWGTIPCILAVSQLWATPLSHHRTTHHKATAAAVLLPDSFLRTQISTLDDLVRQAKTNSTVRARYAHVYNIPADAVPGYFRAHLVAGKLKKAGDFTISLIRPSGLVYPVRLALTEGTPIFTDKSGAPAMLRASGNPISEFHMAVEIHTIIKKKTVYKRAPETNVVVPTDQPGVAAPVVVATPVYTPPASDGATASK